MASKYLYVYSTLSSPVAYETTEGPIEVAGGANVAGKHLDTPRGVVTKVTAEQLALLEDNHVFKLHKENGFVTVDSNKEDPDKVASDMTGRDLSAPDTAESLEAEGAAVPVDDKTSKAKAK